MRLSCDSVPRKLDASAFVRDLLNQCAVRFEYLAIRPGAVMRRRIAHRLSTDLVDKNCRCRFGGGDYSRNSYSAITVRVMAFTRSKHTKSRHPEITPGATSTVQLQPPFVAGSAGRGVAARQSLQSPSSSLLLPIRRCISCLISSAVPLILPILLLLFPHSPSSTSTASRHSTCACAAAA